MLYILFFPPIYHHFQLQTIYNHLLYTKRMLIQGKRQNKMGQNKISLIFPNNPLFLLIFSLIIFVTSFSLLIVGFSPNFEKMFFFSLIFAYFFLIFSGVLFCPILFCPILRYCILSEKHG